MILVMALITALLIMVTIAGYFVYTIVPYNKADAEWSKKYGKLTKVNPKEES